MKSRVKGVLATVCLAASLTAVASEIGDSVLLWMADTRDVATDCGRTMTVGDLLSRGLSDSSANGKQVNAARVRVYQGTTALTDGSGDGVFLDLYEQDSNGNWFLPTDPDDRANLLSFDDGVHEPASGDKPAGTYVGPSWADFGQYADETYSFAIELGFLTDNGDWFTMATGEIVGYDNLEAFRTADRVEDPRYVPWRSTYSVPEPSCGLLMLVGGALLALKRRKAVSVGV